MTIREASKRLGYALQTTYRLIWAGELRAQKEVNGRWQVSKEAVEKRLAERLVRYERVIEIGNAEQSARKTIRA